MNGWTQHGSTIRLGEGQLQDSLPARWEILMSTLPLNEDARALAARHVNLARRQAIREARISGRDLEELTGEAMVHLCIAAAWFDPDRVGPDGQTYAFAPIAARIISQRLAGSRRRRQSICFTDLAARSDGEDRNDAPSEAIDRRHPDPARAFQAAENLGRLKRKIQPVDFAILWLRFAEERTTESISQKLGIHPATVQLRLKRVRERLSRSNLRHCLEDA